jgi:hypothetical protein
MINGKKYDVPVPKKGNIFPGKKDLFCRICMLEPDKCSTCV